MNFSDINYLYKNSLINIEITDENQEKLEDLSPKKNIKNNRDNKSINILLEDICGEKLRELNLKLSESTKNQNSNECFRIKECINEITNIGKKIYDLQRKKADAVNEENFDKAMELKQSIDVLQKQLSKIDIEPKKSKSKRKRSSAKKNSSNTSSGNNSFIDNVNNILVEIKEVNETDLDNKKSNRKKKKIKFANKTNKPNPISIPNSNPINDLNTINNINDINNYNMTNYSNLSNNTKTLDLSQGKIISNLNSGRKNIADIDEDEFYKQYDDRMLPAQKKKKQVDKSIEEIEQENEEKYKKQLGPLKEITKEHIEKYKLLIDFIQEEGLTKILSNQYDYKIEGFDILSNELQNIFDSDNIEDIAVALFTLIAELFEDKKNAMNITLLDLVLSIFKHLSDNINKIDLTKELSYLITDRIINKIQLKLNDSSAKIRKKSIDIIIFVLYHKIIDIELLVNNLLSNDIKNKNNNHYTTNTFSIISKLDIIKNILENYSQIINEDISSEDNFPKNIISSYLIMYINSPKNEIKNKCRPLMELAIDKLGLKIFKEKLMDFSQKEIEKLKIKNLKPITDFLKEINYNFNLSSDYTLRESISRLNSNKPNEEEKNRTKSKSRSRSKSKGEKNKKIENYNKCSLCQKQLGNENIIEHMKKCIMVHQCKKCKVYVEVKNLTQHRLNECSKKDKFKLCERCQEAILIELY